MIIWSSVYFVTTYQLPMLELQREGERERETKTVMQLNGIENQVANIFNQKKSPENDSNSGKYT